MLSTLMCSIIIANWIITTRYIIPNLYKLHLTLGLLLFLFITSYWGSYVCVFIFIFVCVHVFAKEAPTSSTTLWYCMIQWIIMLIRCATLITCCLIQFASIYLHMTIHHFHRFQLNMYVCKLSLDPKWLVFHFINLFGSSNPQHNSSYNILQS